MYDVSMRDYEGLGGGFHGGSAEMLVNSGNVEDFKKALQANYQSPRMGGSAVFRVESLEQSLRIITWQNRHIVLWYDIGKAPAYSTVHEYNVQTSYGVENGAFVAAGEPGQVRDGTFSRKSVLIKYMATTSEVDHPTTLVRSAHGNLIAKQTQDAALWLMKMAEKALFFGRSDVIPQEFDGFDQLIRQDTLFGTTNVIDMRDQPLGYDAIAQAAEISEYNYSSGTNLSLYLSPGALSDLGKQQQVKERLVMPAPQEGIIGSPVHTIRTTSGDVALKKDIFLRPGRDNGNKKAPAAATATRAPAAPITGAYATNLGATTGSLFVAADVGAFQYKVTAVNRYGESAALQETGGVSVSAAGDGIQLVITDGGGETATGYRVYRSRVGGAAGTEEFIFAVPRQGATTTVVDLNRYLPGCSRAYLFLMSEEVMNVVQLAPMFKVPFGTQALAMRWAQGMYLAPINRAPGKCVIFDNVRDR